MKSLDLWAPDHTAIADEGDLTPSKTRNDFVDLRGECLGVLSISGKDFNCQRASRAVAQQPNDNLLLSTFPIAVVTESAEGVVFALKVSAGDIVEKETLRWPLLVEEEFFDV